MNTEGQFKTTSQEHAKALPDLQLATSFRRKSSVFTGAGAWQKQWSRPDVMMLTNTLNTKFSHWFMFPGLHTSKSFGGHKWIWNHSPAISSRWANAEFCLLHTAVGIQEVHNKCSQWLSAPLSTHPLSTNHCRN